VGDAPSSDQSCQTRVLLPGIVLGIAGPHPAYEVAEIGFASAVATRSFRISGERLLFDDIATALEPERGGPVPGIDDASFPKGFACRIPAGEIHGPV